MTLKEVKETLQTWIATADDEYDREEMGRVCGLKEALHEINKIDVCEDVISRQAAIEAAEKGCLELKGVFERVKDNLKALPSANVCTDAIGRQAVLDTIENEQKKIMRSDWAIDQAKFSAMSEIRALIEELPSVSMEKPNRWISVNERLPSDDEYVIVSVLDDHGDTPWKYTTVAWLCNGVWISDNNILCGTAVAWMSLPQPYKAESEDKE